MCQCTLIHCWPRRRALAGHHCLNCMWANTEQLKSQGWATASLSLLPANRRTWHGVVNSSFVEIYVSPTGAISTCITKTTLASVLLELHLQTPRFTFLFSIHKQAVSTSSREDKTYNTWIKRCSEGGDNAVKDKHFFQKEGKNLDQVWHFHAAGRQLQHNLQRGDSLFLAVYQLVWGKICWCTWNESGKKCQPLLTLFPHVNNFTDY